jgi:hypothetical protein
MRYFMSDEVFAALRPGSILAGREGNVAPERKRHRTDGGRSGTCLWVSVYFDVGERCARAAFETLAGCSVQVTSRRRERGARRSRVTNETLRHLLGG